MHKTRVLLFIAGCCFAATSVMAQENPIPENLRGDENRIARGILDGNLIETNFRNHGELARWNDLPWGIWPRGIGGRHIDGVGIIVAGQVPGQRVNYPEFFPNATQDTTLNPMILTYREAGKRLGPSGEIWGWLPLPGFNNPDRIDPITSQRVPTPALSNDPSSWPDSWPDRLDNLDDPGWPGQWNGFFGKGVFNADLESYYVMDDLSDMEYNLDPETGRPNSEFGVYFASPSKPELGGMGLQNRVRIFQWANVLAEDVMFILYRVTNIGEWDHNRLFFGQIMDYGLGNEEGDENGAFNPQEDVAYGWDQDGIGTRPGGGEYELGYTGFAFLESPARTFDGQDNDEDGITDESRFSGPGTLIEGENQIRAAAMGAYDITNFELFNGPLDDRPAVKAGRWWTGDENMDWVGFSDENGNGQWDQGESVNNDIGADGLGPFDFGYPGPDAGETDGIPTLGEPNFDELDVDESDQVGLTGFDLETRPFYESGDNLREDSWLWERIMVAQFPLGTKPDEFEADIEPFLLFTSGPVPLAPGASDFFSTAWIFGEDERDFFKNRRTVQSIFNADYSFAQPPFLPKLTAVPGDGQVALSWDTTAVASFDRFTQEFDFEGFRLYKGTDPLLSDARLISDINGSPTFYRPLAQWDLNNGIRGPVAVLEGEAAYNLGDDTGLQFSYVDTDVKNGITYYYAIVAYDRGFRDASDPTKAPIDPQENVFNVSVTQAGQVTNVSRNAAVVIPRSAPIGYVQGGANEDLSNVTSGIGSGSINVQILLEDEADFESVYRVNFFSEPISDASDLYRTSRYEVINATTGETLIPSSRIVDVTPPVGGFSVEFNNITQVSILRDRTGYVANEGSANEVVSPDPTTLDGYDTNWFAFIREDTTSSYFQSPYDYELRWVNPDDSLYTPPRIFGFLRDPIPVFAINTTLNEQVELLVQDINESGVLDAGDDLIINDRTSAAGNRRYRYRISFFTPPDAESIPPGPGSVLRITVERPFATGDFFQFTLRPSDIDEDRARNELDRIAVVPNPYVGASGFEPRSQIEGRGERRVQFINLPPECTIKIYNIRGELVQTIVHSGSNSDGAEFWDLRTLDQQDIAYGVYIFHVDAPGIGEHVGKFALIK